jgi:hypothetical protein
MALLASRFGLLDRGNSSGFSDEVFFLLSTNLIPHHIHPFTPQRKAVNVRSSHLFYQPVLLYPMHLVKDVVSA